MGDAAWMVTTGEYSDYTVRAVFDARGRAEAFAAALREKGTGWEDREARVERVLLNPTPDIRQWWHVHGFLSPDGGTWCQVPHKLDSISAGEIDLETNRPTLIPSTPGRASVEVRGPDEWTAAVVVTAAADDKTMAERACRDKVMELAALGYDVVLARLDALNG